MALPPGFLDELRGRISLSGLVGRQVRLTRRGREFAGLCPFHHEKTPSFYVVEDKAFFHCFGCGAHGDAIGFVMRLGNLDFIEAVEKLAAEAGLAVPQASPQERERAQRQKTLLEALAAAAAFYEARLWSPSGGRAREYLEGRGLDADTIRHFRLGWAPDDRRALRRALAGDFPEPLLLEAGLLRPADDGEPYDYFRDRVMFPILDRGGRAIAFGGRVLGDGQPKYLNSPETPLFEKGRVLYGWAAARAHAGREAEPRIVVTEGYMDVIALNRAGFGGAVAPLGTALTEAQLGELWRLAPEPILCFDGDAAGQRAAARALRRALPLLRAGQSLRFASLPAGEDPDSLVRQGGPAIFEQVLAAARSCADMLWELRLGSGPRDTPERIANIRQNLEEDVRAIADATVRQEYANLFKKRINPYEARAKSRWRPRGGDPGPSPHVVRIGAPPPPRSPERVQREILFRILLRFPPLIEEVYEEFGALTVPEPELDRLRRAILEAEALRPGLDAPALKQHLLSNGFVATVDGLLSPSGDAAFMNPGSEPGTVRGEWAHVFGMLSGGVRSGMAEASNDLLREISPESWDRFLAAENEPRNKRRRALRHGLLEDDRA